MSKTFFGQVHYGHLLVPGKVIFLPGPKIPSYARETMTSRQHTREDLFSSREIPQPDALELKRSRSDLSSSMISEEPLIDQERQKNEEYLVIIALLFAYLSKTTT